MTRVLIIEDNPDDRYLLTYLLQTGGYAVTEAHGGEEGIEAALAIKPDLILCDLRMPDLSGYDVLARLRDSGGVTETPVVAVTIRCSAVDRRSLLDAGFSGLMPKPIDPPGFLAEIAFYLRGTEGATEH